MNVILSVTLWPLRVVNGIIFVVALVITATTFVLGSWMKALATGD